MEDYKEKYEQLTKFIKDLYPFMSDYCKEKTEGMIPELKESEDERMRKQLLNWFKDCSWDTIDDGNLKREDIIAWLEKQGEQKPKDKPKFKVGDWITNGACTIQITSVDDTYYWHDNDCVGGDIESMDKEYHFWTIQDAKDGDVIAFDNSTIVIFKDLYNATTFHSYCHIEDDIFNISKDDIPDWWRGEGFHPATKEQHDLLFQKMKEAGYEWDAEKKELNKIEQKPKDKPKFKVGDWITNGACTIQITSVDDTYYWHDNDCVGGDIESMDKEYHFWTIQDAKDGDVLANDNSIIIFRSIGNYRWNDAINYYVVYKHNLDKIIIQHDDSYYGTVNTITFEPATKEQIDLLSQKMKEAGYEWDAEKKELNKIESL